MYQKNNSLESSSQLSCYPFGVGSSTEGVAILLNLGKYRILLDCGLNNIQSLLKENLPPVDWVFCSHAHQDHACSLLYLHKRFPSLPIYTSEVTAKLLPLNWLKEDLTNISSFCHILPWRSPIFLEKDLSVEIFPAGHLPGAAMILIKYITPQRTYKILYTGDFCLSNLQLVEGLSLESLRGLAPDVLIVEGTYGTSRHPNRRQQEGQLMERIKRAIAEGKNIVLPLPSFGLAQEILKLLRSHHLFTGVDLDIWVDGNLAIACDLYLELIPYLPQNVQNFAQNQPLFWDKKILPRTQPVTEKSDRTAALRDRTKLGISPCIILTDNLAYLPEYCNDNGSWLILVSKHSKIRQNPEFIEFTTNSNPEKIIFETYLLTEHSDGKNTTQLIHNLRPQHIVFFHGSPNYLTDLTSLEELQNRYKLHCPTNNSLVELPIAEQFIQPAIAPKNNYEGELNETGAFITITLPDQITKDPRWQNFADTGLIEGRWQGEELVLRGLSQREILQQSSSSRRESNIECCQNCIYYDDEHCFNPHSPLYEFEVTPNGSCPVFESL